MFVRTLVAAIAIIAVPIAVNGARPAGKVRNDATKRICTVQVTIGTRLGRTRVCRTRAERDQMRNEGRDVIERVQNRKALNAS